MYIDLPPATPIAIAFSGGGDSTALVHKLKDYNPKPLILIVNHALRDGSAHEAEQAKAFVQMLGLEARILTWAHDNPVTGLQEKARKARYGLLGAACRKAGVEYCLTAHTEDDQVETLLMRYDKNTDWRGAAGMAKKAYAPVWPQLAAVTLVRPLLGTSRESLRAYSQSHDLSWTEDPSNENRDFTRIRARDYLAARPALKRMFLSAANDLQQARAEERFRLLGPADSCEYGSAGEIVCPAMPPLEFLRLAILCVSGTSEPARRAKLKTQRNALVSGQIKTFTLSGAQVVLDGETLIISRDPVAATGRVDSPLKPSAAPIIISANPQIWDGRFLVSSKAEGFALQTRHSLNVPQSPGLKTVLNAMHKSVRHTAPIISDGHSACSPAEVSSVCLTPFTKDRLYRMLAP